MSKLIIRRGDEFPREIGLGDHRLRIGRGPQNDVVLTDPTKAVSRVHAELRIEGGKYVLVDLDSRNGLWVRGRRQATIALETGVPITIGTYTVVLEGPPTSAEETRDLVPATETATTVAPTLLDRVEVAAPIPPFVARQGETQLAARSGVRPIVAPPPAPAPPKRFPVAALAGGIVIVLAVVAGIAYLTWRQPAATPAAGSGAAAPSSAEATAPKPQAADQPPATQPVANPPVADQPASNQPPANPSSVTGAQPVAPETRAPALAETDRAAKPRTAATQPPAVSPAQPAAADNAPRGPQPRVRRRAGESTADWYARDRETADRYEKARSALEAGSFQAALATFTDIQRGDPDYPEAAAMAARAREGMRGAAQSALDAGQKAEAGGDLAVALQQYERAAEADSSARGSADEAGRRVRARMRAEGADAFKQAGTYYALNRVPEAIRLYEIAYKYLPEDDPNRKTAKDRLDALRKK